MTQVQSLAKPDAKSPAPPPTTEGEEPRRTHERHPLNLRVRYPRRNAFFYEFTRNVSNGGMFIDTEHPLEPGRQLLFELDIPGEKEPLTLLGEVRWRVRHQDAPPGVKVSPGMGIEFLFKDADERKNLFDRVRRMIRNSFGHEAAEAMVGWPH